MEMLSTFQSANARFVQCLQWAHGFDIKFGLYAWEPGMGSRREERAATPLLANIYKNLASQVPASRTRHPVRDSLPCAMSRSTCPGLGYAATCIQYIQGCKACLLL